MIIPVIGLYIIGVALIVMGTVADDGEMITEGLWLHIAGTALITIKMMGGLF